MSGGWLIAVSAFDAAFPVGDDPVQSALHAASPEAREIARLWWVMFWTCTVVFFAVVVFSLRAVSRGAGKGPPGGVNGFVIGGGIVLPVVVLTGFLIYSLRVSVLMGRPSDAETIEVIGHQFWWEVRYPDHGVVIANEIYMPAGERVRFVLKSADVIHSFWVPNLHGKRDMIPGISNEFWMQAERAGEWRGQCAEFCGIQHALMAFVVVALERPAFERWIAERRSQIPPDSRIALRGREAFERHGCGACHAISGLPGVTASIGPDLTHIGSRHTLGAGTIANTPGNLAGWIANPQAIKPGSRMPPTYLEPDELHALVEYLGSLR